MADNTSRRNLPPDVFNVQALTAGVAAQTLDASTANFFTLTLTVNTTFAIKNGQPGVPIFINLAQDGTGGRTLAYNGAGGMTITGPATAPAAAASAATSLIVMPTSYTAAVVVSNQQ